MHHARTWWLALFGLLAVGCAPRVMRHGYTAADLKLGSSNRRACTVSFQYRSKLAGPRVRELGRIQVEDSGFSTHCSEPEVRAIVRADACGLGAQVVDIQTEKEPSIWATCYHMDARLLALTLEPAPPPPTLESLEASKDSMRKNEARKENRKLVWSILAPGIAAAVAIGVVAGLSAR